MSTTDHSEHPNSVALQCSTPVLDPISVLRDAVGFIATGDHSSSAEATDQLVALGHTSGHYPLCVACEVARLVDPAAHPPSPSRAGGGAPAVDPPSAPAATPPTPGSRAGMDHRAGRRSTHPTHPEPTNEPHAAGTQAGTGAGTGAGTERRRLVAVSTTAPQPGQQPDDAAVVGVAAPARALHLVRTPAPVCRCLRSVLPVAGHHQRCPFYSPS